MTCFFPVLDAKSLHPYSYAVLTEVGHFGTQLVLVPPYDFLVYNREEIFKLFVTNKKYKLFIFATFGLRTSIKSSMNARSSPLFSFSLH